MSKINKNLLSEGVNFGDIMTYKSPYCFNKVTGKEAVKYLNPLQKLCNIASSKELVGFTDYKGNPYIFLRQEFVGDGEIVPLRSEDLEQYFRQHYFSFLGQYCKEEDMESFLLILEALCLKHRDGSKVRYKLSDLKALLKNSKTGGANE